MTRLQSSGSRCPTSCGWTRMVVCSTACRARTRIRPSCSSTPISVVPIRRTTLSSTAAVSNRGLGPNGAG
ncbi:MAG: hypothetical protein AMS18_00045 [Gemmatimonas sp. SG8_17]|nr:MAG: hypothetical protein AMS18_00045 [Gemmatimonas sp. SG8_17]